MDHLLEQLYQQHREAERMLDRLADAERLLRREGYAAPGLGRELVDIRAVLQAEIDSHFREEEWALFPVLGRHIGVEEGPIAAMMDDHALFRRLQLELDTGLAALESAQPGAWTQVVTSAAVAIVDLLPGHIQKEEGILFPMADDLLSEAEWDEARHLWRAPEAVR